MASQLKKYKKNIKKSNSFNSVKQNSYSGLTQNVVNRFGKPQNSTLPMAMDSVYEFITLNRQELSYLFLHNPIVNVIITKPVQDALRGGINFQCEELGEEINNFISSLENEGVFEIVRNLFFWSRLFGGSGLFINQEFGDPTQPFSIHRIRKGEKIEFYALDRWQIQTNSHMSSNNIGHETSDIWVLGNERIHNTRVLPVKNKEVPSMLRGTFQYWGISEIERTIREMNFYLKSQNVLFELVDEAKVDIFSIENLNDAFTDPTLTQAIYDRVLTAAQLKSYLNALVMDSNDKYESKSINFSGIKDVVANATAGISIASQIPQDHWAGTGASGFSSGEDVIERYNSMVESDVRTDMKKILNEIIQIKMKQMYGKVFNFSVDFKPLRLLSAEEEEKIKKSQQERILNLFERDIIDRDQVIQFIEKNNLMGG